ncbi:MAG: sulfatase [Candidatus Omnitrophica bacterium]|jgi:arylsulfatase A-like enzyme|nr:sulfatase [Candidatus Omnitrophota bacterium]
MPDCRKILSLFLLSSLIPVLPLYAQSPVDPASGYNLIFICLDTLRPDHLGCYGYGRNTSPRIDAISGQGVLFKNAFAQSNFTLASHASLFTSKYAHSHNADRIERRLADEEITIAEVLKANGYKTAAFIHNAQQFDPKFGLNQGFETYDFAVEANRRPSIEKTLPACLKWITRHKNERFFVFLHANDIHEPYHCPDEDYFDEGYHGRLDQEYMATWPPGFHTRNLKRTKQEARHIIAHYDAGIRYTDSYVGKFFDHLKGAGLLNKTILVFFSDHGEILGERKKFFGHGLSLHDEEVRAALLFCLPQAKQQTVEEQAQLVDIMPTVLELLRIDTKGLGLEGKSLVKTFLPGSAIDEEINEYVYAGCLSGESEDNGLTDTQAMIRSRSWKLITHTWEFPADHKNIKSVQMHNGAIITAPFRNRIELYDLRKDPREINNLAGRGYDDIENMLLSKLLELF